MGSGDSTAGIRTNDQRSRFLRMPEPGAGESPDPQWAADEHVRPRGSGSFGGLPSRCTAAAPMGRQFRVDQVLCCAPSASDLPHMRGGDLPSTEDREGTSSDAAQFG
jgi:hypothetical protein